MKKKTLPKTKKHDSKHDLFAQIIGFLLMSIGVYLFITLIWFIVTTQKTNANVSTRLCDQLQSCPDNLLGKEDPTATQAYIDNHVIDVPTYIARTPVQDQVLGVITPSNRHIAIDLTTQTLYAEEGNAIINSFPIASGKWSYTPTGHFNIWVKLQATRMVGGNKAAGTYYNLPNVHFTQYLYNDTYGKAYGLGIHEAYWLKPEQFGHPQSHGCINMRLADAEWLFNWTNPKSTGFSTYATQENTTPVDIFGTTPTT